MVWEYREIETFKVRCFEDGRTHLRNWKVSERLHHDLHVNIAPYISLQKRLHIAQNIFQHAMLENDIKPDSWPNVPPRPPAIERRGPICSLVWKRLFVHKNFSSVWCRRDYFLLPIEPEPRLLPPAEILQQPMRKEQTRKHQQKDAVYFYSPIPSSTPRFHPHSFFV